MALGQLKKEYNQQLARWRKAFEYMLQDDADRDKYLLGYIAIGDRLNEIVAELRSLGEVLTHQELMEGMK